MAERDGRGAALEQGDVPPSEGAERSSQALLWGLRRTRDEAQLTQVIAEVARADPGFARAFVELLLDTAEGGTRAENVGQLRAGGLPTGLICRAEEHLRDTGDASLGRVDLRFDGGGDFTLFVENKLYSGYGPDQVKRYLAALERLPPERRAGLVAVTRNVPTYGEAKLDAHGGWLGSVRWAHMGERLRDLPISDTSLSDQWRLFVDLLDQQGDLGMTRADAKLIEAWSQYLKGREHLADILDQVWPRALDVVEREIKKKYGRRAKGEQLVAILTRGKKQQVVQRDQTRVYIGFRIPARVKDAAMTIQFSNYFGTPHFTVQATPWEAQRLIDADDRQFLRAARQLEAAEFQSDGHYWAHVHERGQFLEADDVPNRLLELVERDVSTLVGSGILDQDVMSVVNRQRSAPPRDRKAPARAHPSS